MGKLINMENLREKLYKTQFWEYDYDNGCEKANEVLKSLETIKENPMLLEFVLKCLVKNEIKLKKYFYIIVHREHRGVIYDVIINKIFDSVDEAEKYSRCGEFPDSLLYERYSIKPIN
jgi:hypothetical protein